MEKTTGDSNSRLARFGLASICCAIAMLLLSGALAATAQAQDYSRTTSGSGYETYPIYLDKGAVRLTVGSSNTRSTGGISYDQAGNNVLLGTGTTAIPAGSSKTVYAGVKTAGTYYLIIGSDEAGATATVKQYGTDKTLKNKVAVESSSQGDNTSVSYYKVKVKKKGYLSVSISDIQNMYTTSRISICNSKKKSVTGGFQLISNSDGVKAVGVKKGTYYIAVKSYAPVYRIQYAFHKVSAKSATKKSKAVTIKKGKKAKGVLIAGGKAQWYKFKQTKNKKFSINIVSKGFGPDMAVTVYRYNKKMGTWTMYAPKSSGPLVSTGNLHTGTYYVKVAPKKKGASGYYTLKWK